jgi:hypothetical protein
MVNVSKNCNFAKPFVIHNYNPDKLVKIIYSDDKGAAHSTICFLQKGKLLIPLGSGSRWLLHKHSYIDIKLVALQKNGEIKSINSKNDIKIKNIRFLKLKGVGVDD